MNSIISLRPNINGYCKPTFICGYFISRLTSAKLVFGNLCSRPNLIRPVLSYQPNDKDWFALRNIRDEETLANLAKITRMRIKLGLQYFPTPLVATIWMHT